MDELSTDQLVDMTNDAHTEFIQGLNVVRELARRSYDKRLIINQNKFNHRGRITYISRYLSFSTEKNDSIMINELSKIIKREQIDTSDILFYNGMFLYDLYQGKHQATDQIILDTMVILVNNAKDKGILRSIINELSRLKNDDIICSVIKEVRSNYNKDELITLAFSGLEYNACFYDSGILNYLIRCTDVSIDDIKEYGRNNLSRTKKINQWLENLEEM